MVMLAPFVHSMFGMNTTKYPLGTMGLVIREQNALDRFVNCIVEDHNLSRADAIVLRDAWLKWKILKIDPVVGQWTVSHGAFLATDPIRRSIARAKCQICKGKGKVKKQICICCD